MSVVAGLALTPIPAQAAPVGTGTIEGTLTTAKGDPVAGVRVQLSSSAGHNDTLPLVFTDEAGHYSAAPLPAGRYRVGFYFPETMSTQWVPRAARESAATWFTVADGRTTVVDESLFATGGLDVTLVEPDTGPVQEFCVEAIGDLYLKTGCTTTGTVSLTGLPIGSYLVTATGGTGEGVKMAFADVVEDSVVPVEIQPW
ncbi:carboxypeptidase-like regulatory domain-containing protein [Paractinoplanes toevensis]|uniref:Alpha-amylase n=1 Tax=Paractinoplanes toevensis TaxID=571911 RepID=A0A919W3X8_9ACTN|nr:carboxypeptidase-like regulatory domain-containing protein [Actinoplanes toevensis]GIM95312.1 hypothetical protein Ato02nite_071050 [Actinoplanes toevensis]